jgi:hypothetical protein
MSATRPSLAADIIEIIKENDTACKGNLKNEYLLASEWVYYIPGRFCDEGLPDSTFSETTSNRLWDGAQMIIPLANKGDNIKNAITALAPLLQHSGMAAIKIRTPTESSADTSLAGIRLFIPHEFYPDGRVAYKLSQRYLKHFLLALLNKFVAAKIKLNLTQSDIPNTVEYMTIGGDKDGESFRLPYQKSSIQNLPVHPCTEIIITDENLSDYHLLDDRSDSLIDVDEHARILIPDFFTVADFCYTTQTSELRNAFLSRQNEVKRLLIATHKKPADEVILKIQTLYEESLEKDFQLHQGKLEKSATDQINLIVKGILELDHKVSACGGKQIKYKGRKYRLPTHAAKMLEILQHHAERKIAASRTLEAVLACAERAANNDRSQKLFARRDPATAAFYTACTKIRPSIDKLLGMVKANPLNIITKKQLIELVRTYQRKFNYDQNGERMKAGRLKLFFRGSTQGIKDLIEFLNSDSVKHLDEEAAISGANLFCLLDIMRERETRTYGTLSGYDLNPDKATNVVYQEIYRILQEGCDKTHPNHRDLAAVRDVLMQRRSNKTYFKLSTNAKRGDPEAMYCFALALLSGKANEAGVVGSEVVIRKNSTKAIKFLQKAADAGHEAAKEELAKLSAAPIARTSTNILPNSRPGLSFNR